MKIYEYIRGENERTIKLFGKTFMSQTSDYMTAERLQSFLGGLITTVKVNDQVTDCSRKDIQVLGHSISKRIEENNYRTYYMFGKEIRKISLIDQFKKQYFKYFDKKHDDIYLLNANSGEAYLFLTYCLEACIKKYGSKNPLLVATKPYHIELIKMICPDIDYVYIKRFNMFVKSDTVDFRIDNFRFFQAFSHKHFMQVEIDIKNDENAHYFKSILEELGLTPHDVQIRKTLEIMSSVKSMLEKVKKINLNLDKFVLIAPEARSCTLINNEYWIELINKYKNEGYDVFVNLVGDDIDLTGADYKTCYLTYSEIYSLAKRAKKIIMLRSGLTELFLQPNVPMEVLYTKFRDRILFNSMEVEQIKRGFGLNKLPFVDKEKIREFNIYEISQSTCLKKIIDMKQ